MERVKKQKNSVFSGFKKLKTRLNILFLETMYRIHIRIRYVHDTTYARGGWYKSYSDKAITQTVHKVGMATFVVSFIAFYAMQSLWPYLFTLKPQKAQAGTANATWTTYNNFTTNNVAGSASTSTPTISYGINLNGHDNTSDETAGNIELNTTANLVGNSNGSDGALTVATGTTTIIPPDGYTLALSGNAAYGGNTLTVASGGAAFTAGTKVLIRQQTGTGANDTIWQGQEEAVVASSTATSITLTTTLKRPNISGQAYNYPATNTQIMKIMQYTTVTLQGTGILTGDVYNGTTDSGILAFAASGDVVVPDTARVHMDGKGSSGAGGMIRIDSASITVSGTGVISSSGGTGLAGGNIRLSSNNNISTASSSSVSATGGGGAAGSGGNECGNYGGNGGSGGSIKINAPNATGLTVNVSGGAGGPGSCQNGSAGASGTYTSTSPSLFQTIVGGTASGAVGLRYDAGNFKVKPTSLTWEGTTNTAGQKIYLTLRAGDSQSELNSSKCYGPTGATAASCAGVSWWETAGAFYSQINGSSNSATTVDSSLLAKRYIEVLVRLESTGANTPTLNSVRLEFGNLENPPLENMAIANSDGTDFSTAGTEGSFTNNTTIEFKVPTASLTCDDCGYESTNRRGQIEVLKTATSFTNSGSLNTNYITDGGTGDSDATVDGIITRSNETVSGSPAFAAGLGYHWRARTVDDQGGVSDWTTYGSGSDIGGAAVADFTIDSAAPLVTGFQIAGNVSGNTTFVGGPSSDNSIVKATATLSDDISTSVDIQFSEDGSNWGVYDGVSANNTTDGSNWASGTYTNVTGVTSTPAGLTFNRSGNGENNGVWKLSSVEGDKGLLMRVRDVAGNLALKVKTSQADWEAATLSSGIDSSTSSGNAKISSGDSSNANMFMFWDGGAAPTGWTIVSDEVGEPFYNRFIRGGAEYTGTPVDNANTTHTHTYSAIDLAANGGGGTTLTAYNTTLKSVAYNSTNGHTHTLSGGNSGTSGASSEDRPPYRSLKVIKSNSGLVNSIPSGAIGIFSSTVPSGWTRYSEEDNKYVSGAASVATGGSATSSGHSISKTSNGGSLSANAQANTSFYVPSSGHGHTISGTSAAESNDISNVGVILGKANSETSVPSNLVGMFNSSALSGWTSISGVGQLFNNRFIRATTSYGTATDYSQAHTPATFNVNSSQATNTERVIAGSCCGTSASHIHYSTISFSSGTRNLPSYVDVVFATKNSAYNTSGTIGATGTGLRYGDAADSTTYGWPSLYWTGSGITTTNKIRIQAKTTNSNDWSGTYYNPTDSGGGTGWAEITTGSSGTINITNPNLVASEGLELRVELVGDGTGTPTLSELSANFTVYDEIRLDFTPPSFPTLGYYTDSDLTTPVTNTKLKEGTYYIKVSASEELESAPTISINSEGAANDVTNADMTLVSGYDYKYTRTITADAAAVGSTPEVITVTGTDIATNTSTNAEVTGELLTDTVDPTVALTYDPSRPVKEGETLTIMATLSEAIEDSPVMKIALSGENTVSATAMTKTSSTVYTYSHTVASGNGLVTAALSLGADTAGNVVTATPTTGSTFRVDSTVPTASINNFVNKDDSEIINDGGYDWTKFREIKLGVTIADSGTSNLSGLQLSNDGITWGSVSVDSGSDEEADTADDVYTFNENTWYTSGVSNESSFTGDISWLVSSGDGEKNVYFRTRDNALNISDNTSDVIKLDSTAPTLDVATIIEPNDGESWAGGSLHNVTWDTTKITESGIGLKGSTTANGNISIGLEVSGDGGQSWSPITSGLNNDNNSCSPDPATGCYVWRTPNITAPGSAFVRIKATDHLGNTSSNDEADISNGAFSIIYDSSTPTWPTTTLAVTPIYTASSINYTNGTPILSWTSAADVGSGIDEYEIWAKKIGVDPAFSLKVDEINKNATTQSLTLTEGQWQIKIKAIDGASNGTFNSNVYAVTVDTTAPTATLSINSASAATRFTSSTLTFTATDAISGPGTYRIFNSTDITNTNTCTAAIYPAYETYATTKANWDLTVDSSGLQTLTDKGNKKVCATIKDKVGNTSSVIYDRIIFDQQDPEAPTSRTAVVNNALESPTTTVKASTYSSGTFTGTNAIRVTWSGAVDNAETSADTAAGISGYNIYRSEDNSTYTKINGSSLVTSSPYTDTAKIDGRTYYYKIKPVDAAGNGAADSGLPTAWATVALADVTDPASPATFTSNGSNDTQITVQWNVSLDNGVANNYRGKKYILERTASLGSSQPACNPLLGVGAGWCGSNSGFNVVANVNGIENSEGLINRPSFDILDNDTLSYSSGTFTYVDNVPLAQNWYYYRLKVEDSVATPNVSNYIYSLGRGNFAPTLTNLSLSSPTATLGEPITISFDALDRDLDSSNLNELTTSGNAAIKVKITNGANGGGASGTTVLNWTSVSNLQNITSGGVNGKRASYSYSVPSNSRFGTYTVFVNVKDSVGSGTHDLSDSATFVLAPTAPQNLSVRGISSTQLRLTFDKPTNPGITSYKIYRSTSASNIDSQTPTTVAIGSLTDNGTTYSYTDSSLSADGAYYYKVRGVDESANNGAFSSSNNATTPTPAIPSSSSIKIIDASTVEENQNRFALVWSDPEADSEQNTTLASFSSYVIERAENCVVAGCVFADLAETTNKYFVDVSLSSSTKYVYRIRTKDSFNNRSKADLSPTREGQPGAKPSVTVTKEEAGVSTAKIEWTATQEAETQVIYDTEAAKLDEVTAETKTAGKGGRRSAGDQHAVDVTGLTPNTTYYYKIVSKNVLGFNNDFTTRSFKTTDFSITHDEKSVSTTTTTATIEWETSIEADAAVEYKKESNDIAENSSTAGDPSLEKSHKVVIKGLKPDTNYTYKIRSVTADKYIAETQFLSFRTNPYDASQFVITPNASSIAEQNITATSAKIVWNTSAATTSWLDYGTVSGVYSQSAGNDAFNTVHVVELLNLTPGKTYYYRVRGEDVNEIEYNSKEYTFTAVLKPELSNIKIKDVDSYSATISFDSNVDVTAFVALGKDTNYGGGVGKNEFKRNHSILLENLEDATTYHYQVTVKDKLSNEAKSVDATFQTPLDTTGPSVKEVKIDLLPMGTEDETASAIISWTTDKPATTQVEYDEGIVGNTYSNKTIPDKSLNRAHTVIVKELTPGTTYRFRIVSEDKKKNLTRSQSYNFVTPTKEKSILQLIIRSLEETFSWVRTVGTRVDEVKGKIFGG